MNQFPSILEGIDDLNDDHINGLMTLAKKIKDKLINRSYSPFNNFSHEIIATSFLENSTRTKLSFAVAIQKLGAMYLDFNAEKSSMNKGESIEETLLTLYHQGVNLCILRTSITGQLKQFKENPPIKIINGGDGVNEHPTQALLDLFTFMELGLELEGKTVTIVGDCIHSRVGHSLCRLLPKFGMNIILCGPKNFLPEMAPKNTTLSNNLDEAIKSTDYLYLLRIQKERHSEDVKNKSEDDDYIKNFGVTSKKLKKWNRKIPIFHPGPCNLDVEISADLLRTNLYKGYEQVKNSIYMRMAIIEAILENGDQNIGKTTSN